MPTPESASFLAAKPSVLPTFDGVDYNDNRALKAAQDAVIREQWVQSMMARLIREEMGKCYYREGVNHLEKCGALRVGEVKPGKGGEEWDQIEEIEEIEENMKWKECKRYMEQLKHAKIKGHLFQQQNYIPKE